MSSDSSRYVHDRAGDRVNRLHEGGADEESRQGRMADHLGHTDVVFFDTWVGILKCIRDRSYPSPSWFDLSVAVEDSAGTTIHDLLQVYTIDVDCGSFNAISILIIDEKAI